MPKIQMTNHNLLTMSCPEKKRKETYYDTKTSGLCLEIRCSGGKTWFLRYSDERGKTRYTKLANFCDINLKAVRELCDKTRSDIALGRNPKEEKQIKKKIPTFATFATEYYIPYVKVSKKSWETDEILSRVHLQPHLGKKYLDEITSDDVINLQKIGLKKGCAPSTVNRHIILLRYMFNLALQHWKIPGLSENPTRGIRLLKVTNKKERYVTPDEMQRLFEGVKQSKNKMLPFIVSFLVLTGARRNEVLYATWKDVNLEKRDWFIPITKSGNSRHIPLNEGALMVLENVKGLSKSEYIFGNPNTRTHYKHIYYTWDIARKRAGLPDVRMHDLRHTFASILVNSGRSLYEVQKLLGHTQVKTTQRYAHLTQETLLTASNTATLAMLPALELELAPSVATT
jgi:integrase